MFIVKAEPLLTTGVIIMFLGDKNSILAWIGAEKSIFERNPDSGSSKIGLSPHGIRFREKAE